MSKTTDEGAQFLCDWDTTHKIAEGLKKGFVTVDTKGHRTGPNSHFDDPDKVAQRWATIFQMAWKLGWTPEQGEALSAIANDPDAEPWPEWLPFGKNECRECHECGKTVEWVTNGRIIRTTSDCQYPDGYPDMVMELNVPSGKMVVANDLRDGFRILGDYDVNKTIGIAATVTKYASVGLAYSFVGNTCPSVWRCTKEADRFALGCEDYDEETDEPIPINDEAWETVAGVCTDLWWYSIADYDECVRRYGVEPEDGFVNCKPGVYRFTNRYHRLAAKSWNRYGVFTDIEWVREPDPLHNYKAEFEAQNRTAGQVIADYITRWTLLVEPGDYFSFKKTALTKEEHHVYCVRAAANQVLISSSGRDWHSNGWGSDNPDLAPDAPSISIPIFDQEHSWSHLSEHSQICLVAGVGKPFFPGDTAITYNESFTELAFNILQCIVRHGTKTLGAEGERDLTTEYWAAKSFDGLAKRWPDLVPEYCHDLIGCGKKAKLPKTPKPPKKATKKKAPGIAKKKPAKKKKKKD